MAILVTTTRGQIEICKTHRPDDHWIYMDIHKTSSSNKTLLISYREMNWKDSRDHCLSLGANLLKIAEEEVNNDLFKYFIKRFWGDEEEQFHRWRYLYYWIGGYKENSTWYWVSDNSSVLGQFSSFAPNSPKNNSSEECLEILSFTVGKLFWNDAYCSIKRPFICEIVPDKLVTDEGEEGEDVDYDTK